MDYDKDILRGKRVLVVGGTGSFGTAFSRRCLASGVKTVIAFARDEHKHEQLMRVVNDARLRCFVGDVRDRDRLEMAMRGVDIVVHAAAMKIVPMCERDPIEAIRTNVIGTANIIESSLACSVQHVVVISTDKAVHPANLYGATKLCAERLFVAANAYSGPKFSAVRYGNVVGSAGSVVPLWTKQAREGGPITITHKQMTRFLISMRSACDLVFYALSRDVGGNTYVPVLPSIRIADLAGAIWRKHCAGIPTTKITGIRPGEKLHELLISEDESRRAFNVGNAYIIAPEDSREKPSPGMFKRPGIVASNSATHLVAGPAEAAAVYDAILKEDA